MSIQFYLSDLPELNLAPNGDMAQNTGWTAFGSTSVVCYQSVLNPLGQGPCWFVNKASQSVTCGVRSAGFALLAGQSYKLSLWIKLAAGNANLPKTCIYSGTSSLMTAGSSYTAMPNGWYYQELTFTAATNQTAAFVAVVYDNATRGAFYLDNVMLYPAAGAVTRVEIKPAWNLDNSLNAETSQTRSQSGRLYIYDWHFYAKLALALDFVPEAIAETINGFWQKRSRLLLTAEKNGLFLTYVPGIITNAKTPLSQFQAPYTSYYKGRITFEEL